MKRVSSRQRLVSWDAFDSATINDSDSENLSDYDTAPMMFLTSSSSLDSSDSKHCRKRGRRKHHGPHVVPSFSCEDGLSRSSPSKLEEVMDDVQIYIASFLDVDSVRHLMGVNHSLRKLLLSSDAYSSIWFPRCRGMWHMTKGEFVDSYSLPTAAGAFSKQANLPLLLSMTPSALPTRVDEALLSKKQGTRRSWRRSSLNRSVQSLEMYKVDGKPLVRYTGPIGLGDRCIRSNYPLPRPQRRFTWKPLPLMESAHPTLFDLLCRGARAVAGRTMAKWRPFVAPYKDIDGNIQVTPRMTAYYEVEILAKPESTEEEERDMVPPLVPLNTRTNSSECVAVGVATESFHVHSRMPGWDSQSFGYHGDDGGIFHSSGGMVERFGPCFGPGDTVGCGIDYVVQGIFFTLNGKFLGYGWKGIDMEFLQNDLYPVVGIDTNAPISVNFGSKPFQFDLSSFIEKHETLISSGYQFTDTSIKSTPPRFARRMRR